MQNISVTIPDDVATDLDSLTTVSNFDDAGAMITDYIIKTVTNYRTMTAQTQAIATAQEAVVHIDSSNITSDVTEIANPPIIIIKH